MAEIKTKVSLYFPKDLFKKFEKLREENEGKLGVTISKNEFALKLIADAIDNKDSEPSGKVERAIVADELLKFFRSFLPDIRPYSPLILPLIFQNEIIIIISIIIP